MVGGRRGVPSPGRGRHLTPAAAGRARGESRFRRHGRRLAV